MARLARFIVPGIPHHLTQRGNGRQETFFADADYARYRDLLKMHCAEAKVAIWGWVLMPNHVHLILVPADPDGLRRALSRVHRAYAGEIHARLKRTGHFWQGRFGCVAMDEAHLLAAIRYVALNPVRAGMVPRAEDWPWSSVHAWLDPGRGDGMTEVEPIRRRVPDIARLLADDEAEDEVQALRRAETIGRPVGDDRFLDHVAETTGHDPRPAKRGPKPKKSSLSR